jgi:RNA polymerase sigma-70 factor, ECF subfamily
LQLIKINRLALESTGRKFESLLKENDALIYKICRIYAYTDADREDLYQEIVLQLWRSFQNFRGESKFSTWLYKVGINTALSGFRKQTKFITSFSPSDLPVNHYEPSRPDHDQLAELYTAIQQLNEVEKALVMLYLEDRSYDEMEEIMGISSGTLRVKMNRIKEKLRKLAKH